MHRANVPDAGKTIVTHGKNPIYPWALKEKKIL